MYLIVNIYLNNFKLPEEVQNYLNKSQLKYMSKNHNG